MIKKYLNKNERFIRYTIFASSIAILEVITFMLFHSVLKINILIANTMSFLISVVLLYFANIKFVFKTVIKKNEKDNKTTNNYEYKTRKAKIKRFYLFLGTRVAGLFMDSLVLYMLIEYAELASFPSKMISGISTTLINYIIGKYVFK